LWRRERGGGGSLCSHSWRTLNKLPDEKLLFEFGIELYREVLEEREREG
jgi:hypothetical protein